MGRLIWIAAILLLASCLLIEKDYTEDVNRLIAAMKTEKFKGKSYERLAYLSDTYGPRMWGSPTLELAIEEVRKMAVQEGFENVRLEPVLNFTRWIRKNESLTLLAPRTAKLDMIGIGGSVPGNITAEVIVVTDWNDLEAKKALVPGKIVCYSYQWTRYGATVDYRYSGASIAAKYGAVGALLRSVASSSISSVHTGNMHYDEAYPKIPIAAITVEDSDMFLRMAERKQTIRVNLQLDSDLQYGCNSSNLVFEIVGSEKPNEILLMGGHIDSWDTGSQTGANDDGGGFFTVFESLRLIKQNGLRPKRTLRFIAWSGEEWGGYYNNGARQYYQRHINEMDNHIVAFENDLGSTRLLGFGVANSKGGMSLVKQLADRYLSSVNATLVTDDGTAADTSPLYNAGVPVMANEIFDTPDHAYYFRYHHSRGDTMSIMDPDDMDSNVLGIGAMFYLLADLENTIQR